MFSFPLQRFGGKEHVFQLSNQEAPLEIALATAFAAGPVLASLEVGAEGPGLPPACGMGKAGIR